MIKVQITGLRLLPSVEELSKQQIENKKLEILTALAEATPVDTGEARAGWKQEGDVISNEVPHIAVLNQGTSRQAPAYFIESTVLSIPGVKPAGQIVRQKT